MATETSILQLNCLGCPALSLRTESQLKMINHWHQLQTEQLHAIQHPAIIILCESMPANRYIYDLQTSYKSRGLRYDLKKELYSTAISDEEFIDKLCKDKILIVDCGYCPLHNLDNNTQKRHAATICLQRHNLAVFQQFPDVPVVTIFPKKRGFLKRELPDLSNLIVARYDFGNLTGLKAVIYSLAR
jgi:hypothetical protein